jgi:uncharacterized protein
MSDQTNRLIHETSPYLLQHAHNPVDWYPWGEDALQKARNEDKPILVSIGYSACHWCHVMEKESFENEHTAALMNEYFVNIKIDREERPDLDHIYMDAVQAMTGSGGWPLNVFLTPEAKPFYGGTYFPPVRLHNRPSWQEVLLGIAQAFKEKRSDINAQAEKMLEHLNQSNDFGIASSIQIENEDKFTKSQLDLMFDNIMNGADKEWGGFGRAPKFPQTFLIQFLLRYHYFTGNEVALTQACRSLDGMIYGGIYDHVGGGFARYSTDTEWLVPHFEKMLYDNALLVIVLSEAFQITGNKMYSDVIKQTISFVKRELLSHEDGFFSALDADSEGEEGKFYVWEYNEVLRILGDDAALFCEFYDISPSGNWEHKNIPRILKPLETFASEKKLDEQIVSDRLKASRKKLLEARSHRIRPLLDDKILLSWNALMNIACCKAYSALQDIDFLELAVRNMKFLLKNFQSGDLGWSHSYKNGGAKHPAFLDDYSLLIAALLHLQEITGDQKYLQTADKLIGFVGENFSEEKTGYYFFTHRQQHDPILRKKEIYDGAVPSGNAIMAYNLLHSSILLGKADWKERAIRMADSISQVVIRYPSSFGVWASLIFELVFGTEEIAIVGKNSKHLAGEIMSAFIPNKVLQFNETASKDFPLLMGKDTGEGTSIFLCREYSCKKPVLTAEEFFQLIEK